MWPYGTGSRLDTSRGPPAVRGMAVIVSAGLHDVTHITCRALSPLWENDGDPRKLPRDPCAHLEVRARSGPDRSRDHPQLLHHRAHRPRQVDAGRPHAAADRCGRRAQRACAVPRPHGHRARARHHDQEPGGPDALDGAGRQRRRRARGRLRPEHDRHPRARRLHLRGVPVARGLRGRRAPGRRRAGHRGADPGEPLPRARRRPAHHPGAQQDRPAVRAAREVRRGARAHHRLRPLRRAAGVGQDRLRGRGPAQPHRRAHAGAGRRRGRPAARADLRLGLRHLPRRGHLRPGDRRQAHPPRQDQDDEHGRHPRDARGGRDLPGAGQVRRPRCRRGRLPHHRGEGRPPVPGR